MGPADKSRRFRIARKVSKVSEPPPAEPEPMPPPEEDADPGTPEMNRAVGQGCSGCARIVALILVIMLSSILGTCFLNRNQ